MASNFIAQAAEEEAPWDPPQPLAVSQQPYAAAAATNGDMGGLRHTVEIRGFTQVSHRLGLEIFNTGVEPISLSWRSSTPAWKGFSRPPHSCTRGMWISARQLQRVPFSLEEDAGADFDLGLLTAVATGCRPVGRGRSPGAPITLCKERERRMRPGDTVRRLWMRPGRGASREKRWERWGANWQLAPLYSGPTTKQRYRSNHYTHPDVNTKGMTTRCLNNHELQETLRSTHETTIKQSKTRVNMADR
jgi:hypothetical protein